MGEPSLELQRVIVATLRADPAVNALIAGRVYDRVPSPQTFPYVVVGDDQVSQAHAQCLEGSTEVFSSLHAWSREVGKVEAKQIAGAIVTALNGADLALANGYRLVLIEHDNTQHLGDPDGLTSHSVIVFHSFVDEV
jgi:Protein of unknown function (DUF3168)